MAEEKGGLVWTVEEGSLASHLGLERGDKVVAVNRRCPKDEIDFRFLAADEEIALEVAKRDGQREIYEIEKDWGEPIGIGFHNPLFDKVKTCENNCTFCFVRQIPREMRRTLHVRDDDYRMSFLYGNFLSLTNLRDEDWERFADQRISPLRISVHTTDGALRQEIMGNPKASRIMEDLRRLRDLGIRMHIQIVLLKGINDGQGLIRTLDDLRSLGEHVVSVGVVPAVYTRYRRKPPSSPVEPEWAGETLNLIEHYGRSVSADSMASWVAGADEFYLTADKRFPEYEDYGEFHQYENGIGVVPEWRRRLAIVGSTIEAGADARTEPIGRILLVTGTMAADEVRHAADTLGFGDQVSVCAVQNVFFGDTVTVAGLLTGQDILVSASKAMRVQAFDVLVVPSVAVADGRFLDDLSVETLSRALGTQVYVADPTPDGLLQAVSKYGRR